MSEELDLSFGRSAFGADPAGYRAARPAYPEALYERLIERTGLKPGAGVFEIGPGPGLATGRLLKLGANPLVAIEPDPRLAAYLTASFPGAPLTVIVEPFETAELDAARFDLGTAATSFHWLEQQSALVKVHAALKPGGWWAMWWNVFGTGDGLDPFQTAIDHLFTEVPRAPGDVVRHQIPFAMRRESRVADLERGGFVDLDADTWVWPITLKTSGLVALFASFSPIQALSAERRAALLGELEEIADRQFGGVVEQRFSTVLYTGRRPRF